MAYGIEHGGEKSAGKNLGALVKKYRAASRLLLPRAVFILMVALAILVFASSLFMGAGISIFSAFASSGNSVAAIFLFALEVLFILCGFLVHYGLFLCNLRFVRNQPVAISFLFAGFRQRRAKKFAAFFIVPLFFAFILAIVPLSLSEPFKELYQIQPQEMMEYLSAHPQIMRMMFSHSAFFLLLSLAFYFPFAFVWPSVYDEPKNSFWKILARSLKFWKGRFLKFLAFEIASHYKTALVIFFASGAAEIRMLKKFSENVAAQICSSLFGFVSFCAGILFFASVILSINFFYNEFASSEGAGQSQNENPHQESSN